MSAVRPSALRGGPRAGFILLAVTLTVFAFPGAGASLLVVPAFLLAGVGFALIGFSKGPTVSRGAAAAFAAYVLLLLVLFLVATPFTYGSDAGPVYEKSESEWARVAFEGGAQVFPVALLATTAAAAWPWSPLAGRVILVAGLVLAGGFLVLDWLSVPESESAFTGAARFGTWARASLSLATVALLAAVALVVTPAKRFASGAEPA